MAAPYKNQLSNQGTDFWGLAKSVTILLESAGMRLSSIEAAPDLGYCQEAAEFQKKRAQGGSLGTR
jgi:hypothetical protein